MSKLEFSHWLSKKRTWMHRSLNEISCNKKWKQQVPVKHFGRAFFVYFFVTVYKVIEINRKLFDCSDCVYKNVYFNDSRSIRTNNSRMSKCINVTSTGHNCWSNVVVDQRENNKLIKENKKPYQSIRPAGPVRTYVTPKRVKFLNLKLFRKLLSQILRLEPSRKPRSK